MKRLRIHNPFGHTVIDGVRTLRDDIDHAILPLLRQHFEILDDGVDGWNAVYSYSTFPPKEWVIRDTPVVVHIHRNYELMGNAVHRLSYMKRQNVTAIIHAKTIEPYTREYLSDNVVFFPMRIDTTPIPFSDSKNGKWVYLGNLNTREKALTLNLLRSIIGDIDVISGCTLNGVGNYTHQECLNLASQYTYGIGVGRSALELLSMGVKCMVAGRTYGGVILNDNDVSVHEQYNFNSHTVTSRGTIQDDIHHLMRSGYVPNASRFDIRTWIPTLVSLLDP